MSYYNNKYNSPFFFDFPFFFQILVNFCYFLTIPIYCNFSFNGEGAHCFCWPETFAISMEYVRNKYSLNVVLFMAQFYFMSSTFLIRTFDWQVVDSGISLKYVQKTVTSKEHFPIFPDGSGVASHFTVVRPGENTWPDEWLHVMFTSAPLFSV